MGLFAISFYYGFVKSSDILFRVVCGGILFISTIGSLIFLTAIFFKENKFFNVLFIFLLTPLILMFSIIINVFYFVLVPLVVLTIMSILIIIFYLIIGFILLKMGIDANNQALLYVCTLSVILLYYYFGDRLFKALNLGVYNLASNEYSNRRRVWLNKIFNPDTNRKSLYLLLLLVYIVVKASYFSEYKLLLKFEFINEALLTFVIFDSLVSGKNNLSSLISKKTNNKKKETVENE